MIEQHARRFGLGFGNPLVHDHSRKFFGAQAFTALVKARGNLHRLLHRMFNRESVVRRSLGRPNHENHAERYGNCRAKTSALKIKSQITLGSFLRTESGSLAPKWSQFCA